MNDTYETQKCPVCGKKALEYCGGNTSTSFWICISCGSPFCKPADFGLKKTEPVKPVCPWPGCGGEVFSYTSSVGGKHADYQVRVSTACMRCGARGQTRNVYMAADVEAAKADSIRAFCSAKINPRYVGSVNLRSGQIVVVDTEKGIPIGEVESGHGPLKKADFGLKLPEMGKPVCPYCGGGLFDTYEVGKGYRAACENIECWAVGPIRGDKAEAIRAFCSAKIKVKK